MPVPGFTHIVRPQVFPDLRPRVRPNPIVEEQGDEGVTTLTGNAFTFVSLNHSASFSFSRPENTKETKRTADHAKIYNPEDDSQFVTALVAKIIQTRSSSGKKSKAVYAPQQEDLGPPKRVEIIEQNVEVTNTDADPLGFSGLDPGEF